MKYRLLSALALTIALFLTSPARAAVNVFACEPEWAALAAEIGGDRIEAFSATTARQDPHQITARPTLLARVRAADLVFCTGAELETGWLPALLRNAGNGRVQPGAPGYLEAASLVALLEVPARLDRAEGDVHAAGNPHIQTDPRRIRLVAQGLARRLQEIDPANAAHYAQRAEAFDRGWSESIARWNQRAAPLRGLAVAVQHRNWIYLIDWLGMREVAALEPKPGVPPGPAHLALVTADIQRQQARAILHAPHEDPRPAQTVAQRTGAPAVLLPYTVGGTPLATTLSGLFDDTIARLLAAAGR